MASSKQMNDALDRLAAAEERFLASEFLAPVICGGQVQVRIAGVICQLTIQPADFRGWGVFRPTSHRTAVFVRPARLAERQRYLDLFPQVLLILCGRHEDGPWLAIAAHKGDSRFRIEGMIPVQLVEDAQLLEIVVCRFDGLQFWFESLDSRRDPGTAAYLRQALREMIDPKQLSRSGLTAEERTAYELSYWPKFQAELEAKRDRIEERLQEALAHAGAELREYLEREDVYRVTYEVDGQRHVSVVRKDDLTVQVAGICLSGQDDQFDMQSLVGVIRQAQGGGEFVRVGRENAGMEEDQYWRAHPPRRGRGQ